ncbi:TetR family transcriptional regulator [Streptomyces nigrescens]|uniref:TetR family transcriptional regulator n=1 Tax=Streptomyces nigrescens TaxID=1920 RepID=A0A640TZ47_STRNI|nr:TetR family transcriptional regulator [Streptomyces libani subsp. libani]GGV96371.1 TetR family transcriptional regulator [Streptomyces libani subsp. libani]
MRTLEFRGAGSGRLPSGGTGTTFEVYVQIRAETTRRFLLEAAATLFDEKGYAGTSISDISAHSGRTSGAIYFHYASKEKLALAIVEEHFATWPHLISRYRQPGLPALEKLVGLSFEVARAFRDDIVVRAGARLWAERKAINAQLPAPFLGWIEAVTQLLEEAARNGELAADVPPAATAHGIVCSFFGLHTVSDALEGRRHIEEHLHDLWTLLLRGLQAEPDPAGLLGRVR